MNCKLPSEIFGETSNGQYIYAIKIYGVKKLLTFQTADDRNWFYKKLKERNPVKIDKLKLENAK